jgi:hypothetical protein
LIFGGILLAVVLSILVFGPERLPAYKQPIIPILVALLCGFLAFLLTGTISFRSSRLIATGSVAIVVFVLVVWKQFLPMAQAVPPRPGPGRTTVPALFASFGSKWPNANTGGDWQIFNDNKFLGRSSLWYETVPNPQLSDDYVLRLHFSLARGPRSMASDAYAGIFIDLNPPLGVADLSGYSGIRFRARRLEQSSPSALHCYVSLANPQIANYAYHEHEFTSSLPSGDLFAVVTVPFSLLEQPTWATDRVWHFDTASVYRLAFFVKGDGSAGYLDLDDISFVAQ